MELLATLVQVQEVQYSEVGVAWCGTPGVGGAARWVWPGVAWVRHEAGRSARRVHTQKWGL